MGAQVTPPEDVGSRSLGEPLAVEFVNTIHMVKGKVHDGIGTPEQLAVWLCDRLGDTATGEVEFSPGTDDLRRFVSLRAALRDIAEALVLARPVPVNSIEVLNRASAVAPRWPELALDSTTIIEVTGVDSLTAASAAIARSGIEIFGGPRRGDLRACRAPGCILFFVKNHPRREWCSSGCGNRARVTRYYQRHHRGAQRG